MRSNLDLWYRRLRTAEDGELDGQSMVEYALILVLTTIVCVAVVALLGDSLLSLYDLIAEVIVPALGL